MSSDTVAPSGVVSSLADVEAIERVPLAQRGLPTSTYQALHEGAQLAPDQPALSFFLRATDFRNPFVWTHREWLADITRAANLFRRLGLQRDDVVAFLLPNMPETHFAIWGGETAGITFAINPLLEVASIKELLKTAQAKILVTLGPTPKSDIWEKATAAAADVSSLRTILTVSIAPYLRGPAGAILKALAIMKPAKANGLSISIRDFRREMAKENGNELDFAPAAPTDVSSYFCTGGTTGLPKIAMRTQFAEVFDSWACRSMVNDGSPPGRANFCGLPLFHVNGQLITGLAQWMKGDHVVLGTPQGYRGEGVLDMFWRIVEHYKLVSFSGVPTLYAALLKQPIGDHDISSLQFALCGAAPMPTELFREFEQTTGIKILEGYGLTEGTCASSASPLPAQPRIGSIGIRFPYQQMAVMIVDEAGKFIRVAETNEIGAVAISGPNVFAGYVNPIHNEGIWIDHDGRRWLNTGDLGRQDADGYFWLTGRKKELIIRGGHNIDPKTIEEAMVAHPAVALAAAVGRPEPRVGEVPALYVQLVDGQSVNEADLAAFAQAQIPERAAHPKVIHIVDELPLTPVGKIFKPSLTMLEIESVIRDEAAALDIKLDSVTVSQDSQQGLLAKIHVDGDDQQLRTAVGRYWFASEFVDT